MSFCSPLKLKQHNVAKTENTVLRCKTKNVSRNIHEYPFVTTSWHLALFLLLNILRFPAAPILKEVNAYSAIYSSEMQIAKAACGGKQQFNCLSPNYVSYCKTAAHLSEIKKEEGRGEERSWGWEAVRKMRQAVVGGAVGERGRPKKTDATTVAMALLDINSPEPHCANLIGNVSTVMLCLRHTLASKWNE